MRYTAFLPEGKELFLVEPIEAELSMELSIPADSLRLLLPWNEAFRGKRMVSLRAETEAGETVFQGPIDEQRQHLYAGGHTLELIARSETAILLDNEAVPQTFSYPSLPLLFEHCGKPYGFSLKVSTEATAGSEIPFTVGKGISEWEAMDSFCSRYLKKKLMIKGKTLFLKEELSESEKSVLVVGKNIPVISAEQAYLPCYRYSEIRVRPENTERYSLITACASAKEDGIIRRRFFNGSRGQAEKLLRQAELRAFSLKILSPGGPRVFPGDYLRTESSPGIPLEEALWQVQEIVFTRDKQGERCRYTLQKRSEAECG